MPFHSEGQRRLMWACHPVIAKAWASGKEAPRDYRAREAELRRAGKIPAWCSGPAPKRRRPVKSSTRARVARRSSTKQGRGKRRGGGRRR